MFDIEPQNRPLIELVKRYKKLFMWEGIAFTLLGIFALVAPVIFSLTLNFFLGWLLVFGAVALGIRTYKARHLPHRTAAWINTFLYLFVGLMLLVYPASGIMALVLLMACFFLIDGICKIYWGMKIRPIPKWGWIVCSGVLSFVLAILILALWPTEAAWVLGVLVGINMLFTGLSTLGLLWSLSRSEE